MVGIAGGFPSVIGEDPYEEYPEGGPGDYPEMDSDPMYDPQNIGADPTMQPAAPPPLKKPGLMRRLAPAIGDMIRGGIDAVATPNVAGGGATNMARAMQAAQMGKRQRDMASMQLAYQQQQQQEMMDYRRAQAEAARARADEARQRAAKVDTGSWVNLGNGTALNTATGEQRSLNGKTGGQMSAEAQAAAKAALLEERKQSAIAAGLDPNSREFYAAVYGSAGAAIPKTGVRTGGQGQSMFYKMGADGVPVFTAETPGAPKMGTARGPNGETQFTEQTPGGGGRVVNQVPSMAPRPAGSARTSTRATPTVEIKNLAKQLVSEVNAPNATFEQRRDRAKQMLIQGVWGEHPAVANNKDALVAQIAALTEREFTGATGKESGMPWKSKPAASTGAGGAGQRKVFPRAHLAGYAKRNGISEQSAEGSLNRQGYIVQ